MTRFVFINDETDELRQWDEWAQQKGFSFRGVSSVFEASQIPADYYVFDVSAIGGMFDPHLCYSPICTLAERCPGATYVIVSAFAKNFIQDIIDEVRKITGTTVIYGGRGTFKDLENALSL